MQVPGEYTPQVQNYKQAHEPAPDFADDSLKIVEMA
jgi:hypothetical protein